MFYKIRYDNKDSVYVMGSFLLNLRKKQIFKELFSGRRLNVFVKIARIRESDSLKELFR